MTFFDLSSIELGLIVFGIVLGTTFLGVMAGRRVRAHADALKRPVGVLQAALLGLVARVRRGVARRIESSTIRKSDPSPGVLSALAGWKRLAGIRGADGAP